MSKNPLDSIIGSLSDLLFGEEVLDVQTTAKDPVSEAGKTLSTAKKKESNGTERPNVASIIKPSAIKPKSDNGGDGKPDAATGTAEEEGA